MEEFDFNQPSTWAELYRIPLGNTILGYERAAKEFIIGESQQYLREALHLTPGQNILLVGGGYGFIQEYWEEAGLGPIVTTDISDYIHQTKAENAIVPIYNESALTAESRGNIQSLFNSPIDVIITEDVMPCLTDQQCIELSTALGMMCDNVVHWVTPLMSNCSAMMNWKTLQDWKILLPNDSFIQRGTAEIV